MIKLGFLGPEGTFSEKAADYWRTTVSEREYIIRGQGSISQLFHELQAGRLDQIVVPIENSIEGAVNVTQDFLIASEDVYVLGEINLDIEHYLLSKIPTNLSDIKVVYSHPQALAQCYRYLQQYLSHACLYQTSSTAEAAKMVAQNGSGAAAISSIEAAAKYNLVVQDEKIHDFSGNKTRFWVLGKEIGFHKLTPNFPLIKTSLLVTLPSNRPGGLYKLLKEFADADLDLTRIESRPTKKELGEYLFIIDFLGHLEDDKVINTLIKLRKSSPMLKVLGSYPILT